MTLREIAETFKVGEKVAFVSSNNRLVFGVVTADHNREDMEKVCIQAEDGYLRYPTADRVAHLD